MSDKKPCPNCGHCPTCGRSPYTAQPYWSVIPPYYWHTPTFYTGTVAPNHGTYISNTTSSAVL